MQRAVPEDVLAEQAAEFMEHGAGLAAADGAAVEFDHPEACRQRESFRPDPPDGREGFEQEAAAVFQAASVGVLPVIGVYREETLAQVTVREMQFQQWKAELDASVKVKVADLGSLGNPQDAATAAATAEVVAFKSAIALQIAR